MVQPIMISSDVFVRL